VVPAGGLDEVLIEERFMKQFEKVWCITKDTVKYKLGKQVHCCKVAKSDWWQPLRMMPHLHHHYQVAHTVLKLKHLHNFIFTCII